MANVSITIVDCSEREHEECLDIKIDYDESCGYDSVPNPDMTLAQLTLLLVDNDLKRYQAEALKMLKHFKHCEKCQNALKPTAH